MYAKAWNLVHHSGTLVRPLLDSLDEKTAVRFARSESGVGRSIVSLWRGRTLVAAFKSGEEYSLSSAECDSAKQRLW